jgi:hypothetical protein
MPVYRSDECQVVILKKMYERGDYTYSITYIRLVINQIVFEFCNWLELAYLYYVTKKLTAINND